MRIDGLKELERKLTTLPREAERTADRTVEDVARGTQRTARALAPVDSGELRQSLVVRDAGPHRRSVDAGAFHADDIEFGNSTTAAQPYLRPAYDRERRVVPKHAKRNAEAEFGGT